MEFNLAEEMAAFGDDLIPPLLPAGAYQLIVYSASPGTTSTGKQKIDVTYQVITGPNYPPKKPGAAPKSTKGARVQDMQTWSPGSPIAARIFAETLQKLGASQDWIQENKPSLEQICIRIIGTIVDATIAVDEAFNRNRVNVRKQVKAGNGGGAALNGGSAATAAGSGGELAAVGIPATAEPAAEKLGDDDLGGGDEWP
jgi:hypothetical protein